VKSHLSNIYRKLDVTSRTAATRVAYERQLLQRSASG
jgi:DNA-binding NarL/FixJ family response regulator